MGQMGIEGMWGLGQMDIWMNGHFGVKGHFGTNEHWGKWAFGAEWALCGKWGPGKISSKTNG